MTLAQYLAKNNLTQATFAVRMGVGQTTISRAASGLVLSAKLARRIYWVTEGAVTPNDLLLPPQSKEAAE